VTHELKIHPLFFGAVVCGAKTFEVRKNDRDFKAGDILILKEYDPICKRFTGLWERVRVSFLLDSFEGIAPGYVVMGIRRMDT